MNEIKIGNWGAIEFFTRWIREAVASGAGLLLLAVAGTTLNPSTFGTWADLGLWIEKLALVFASGFIAGLASALSKLIRVRKEGKDEGNTDVSNISDTQKGV